ncbi:DUF2288 family protein [Salinibius halmophilus]|uniref:DUF2288 family protein n=1 Tax=Salinibius halmophilus TaxID=1853216 RepID=UPI000E66E816|nr:DUF2288 family protein [Salinibius halmophilus]
MSESVEKPDLTDPEVAKAYILGQTSKIQFSELARAFAQGKVMFVDRALDMVDVGVAIVQDDAASITHWQKAGQLDVVTDHQAKLWFGANATVWAFVIEPYVFVQPA